MTLGDSCQHWVWTDYISGALLLLHMCNVSFFWHFGPKICHFCYQSVYRQQELERRLQWAQENDKTLQRINDSLNTTDRHLTAYLNDHIDAAQIPQEAQVCTMFN